MVENAPAQESGGGRWSEDTAGSLSPGHVRLAEALRRINELVLTHEAPEELLRSLAEQAEQIQRNVELAKLPLVDEPWQPPDRRERNNDPTTGRYNSIAPPLRFWEAGHEMHLAGTFGAAYEGPPGCVHGGVLADAFDHVLGMAQHFAGEGGMTATLTVRYRRPTPLYRETHFRARYERTEGRKIFVAATLHVDGVLCADAEALFIRVDFDAMRRNATLPPRRFDAG